MADDKQADQEQSMEEILASIRKIISEDDDAEAGRPEADVSADRDDEDDDILDLNDPLPEEDAFALDPADVMAEETVEDSVEAVAAESRSRDEPLLEPEEEAARFAVDGDPADGPEPEAARAEFDMTPDDANLEDDDLVLVEPDPEPAPVREPAQLPPPQQPAAAAAAQAGLLSPEAAALSASALAALRQQGAISGDMGVGEAKTVEGLVRELLRPMLKQWLDVHLPSMVENLVREEIQRLGRQGRD